jgi:tRNA(Ile)-lysidine synthetase-like protein
MLWPVRALRSSSALLYHRRLCACIPQQPFSAAQPELLAKQQPLLDTVHLALEHHIDLEVGELMVVSVSGGADSVALLRLLLDLQPRWRLCLHVLHFNHALRPEAVAEESFVRCLAERHGLPFHVRRLSAGWVDGGGGSIQTRSRKWRQAESAALLSRLRGVGSGGGGGGDGEAGGGALALAHHADDQLETVLMKALRGVHLSRVHGMRWRHGCFVRPLLGVRKAELTSYLRAAGQEWMEDASNAEAKYQRNRVRLQLLPLLGELAGGEASLHARLQARNPEPSARPLHALCTPSLPLPMRILCTPTLTFALPPPSPPPSPSPSTCAGGAAAERRAEGMARECRRRTPRARAKVAWLGFRPPRPDPDPDHFRDYSPSS